LERGGQSRHSESVIIVFDKFGENNTSTFSFFLDQKENQQEMKFQYSYSRRCLDKLAQARVCRENTQAMTWRFLSGKMTLLVTDARMLSTESKRTFTCSQIGQPIARTFPKVINEFFVSPEISTNSSFDQFFLN
jgi:hypothetical protein